MPLHPLLLVLLAPTPAAPAALRPPLAVERVVAATTRREDPAERARRLWGEGRREEAVDGLAAAVRDGTAEADPGARRLLVGYELELRRNAAALEHAAPLGPAADGLRGLALFRLGRYAEALERLLPDEPERRLMRVDALLALGRQAEADRELEQAAAALGEGYPRIATLRGQSLARRGRPEEAIPLFRAALAADSIDLAAWFGLGQALIRSGEREEGLAAMRRHRELVPLVDRLDFALQSLALQPTSAPNHAYLAETEAALGRLDRALASFRRAEELAAGDEIVPVALRHARFHDEVRADLAAALAVLERARARVTDPRLVVRTGDLLLAAGRAREALEQYELALPLDPGSAQIQERIDAARSALGDGR